MSRRAPGQAWPILSVALSVPVFVLEILPELADSFSLSRAAMASGRVWTLLASQFAHWGASHAAGDLAAFLPLAVLCERRLGRARFATFVLAAALAIGIFAWATLGVAQVYRGMSGLAHGVLAATLAGAALDRSRAGATRAAAAAALAILLAKIAWEAATGSILLASRMEGFVPWPAAHLAGTTTGILFELARRAEGR